MHLTKRYIINLHRFKGFVKLLALHRIIMTAVSYTSIHFLVKTHSAC